MRGYLRINDLLELQHPLTAEAHDELLFVIVHQSYELWFKLTLHELAKARSELEDGRPQAAIGPLRRTAAIDRLLLDHLDVLETMGPDGFLEFRDPLTPASGFQSEQFRAIEAESPRLYDAFTACAGLRTIARRASMRSPSSIAITSTTRRGRCSTRWPSCWSTTTS